jgi:hypothetical protein
MAAPVTDMLTTAPTISPVSSMARQGSLTLWRQWRRFSEGSTVSLVMVMILRLIPFY